MFVGQIWSPIISGMFCTLGLCFGTLAQATPQEPLRVVASFSILADMVSEVGGDEVHVTSLVGRNADAHVFDPTPLDAKALAKADVVVINGLGFEGWINRLIKSSGFNGRLIVASTGIDVLRRQDDHGHASHNDQHDQHNHDHDHGDGDGQDPHAWQSLQNAVIYVNNIRDGLIKARPSGAHDINRRSDHYIGQIKALDQQTRQRIAAIAKDKRRVISSHDSFEYFAQAYDITFYGLQGWTTEREVSAADMANLVREIRHDKVQALFVENMSDSRLLQRVAEEAGVRIGGKLYSDALSPPGTEADTYLKMFAFNVDQIVNALKP